MRLFTKIILVVSAAFSTCMLITKVTGMQARPGNVLLSEFDIELLLVDFLAVLATLFTASIGDVEDECLGSALLLSLHFIELIILLGPQGIVRASCKLFDKVAKAIMLLFIKTFWDLIKSLIRAFQRKEDPATGRHSAGAVPTADNGAVNVIH